MQKLLSVVRNKKEDKQIDITLKYTLSALWNLTDESPTTCSVFLGEGGMELFIKSNFFREIEIDFHEFFYFKTREIKTNFNKKFLFQVWNSLLKS